MPRHVGYLPWLQQRREQIGLSDDELEYLLTIFPDNVLASYFRMYYSAVALADRVGMDRARLNSLWRSGPIAAMLRGDPPSAEINRLGDILLAGLTDSPNDES